MDCNQFGLVEFGFMAYQPLSVIWCRIPFYTYKQFYLKKKSSLASVHNSVLFDP